MLNSAPLLFDSAKLSVTSRMNVCREEFGRRVLNLDLRVTQDLPFRLRVAGAAYGNARVAIIDSTPMNFVRDSSSIADGQDFIGAIFPLAGHYVTTLEDDSCRLNPSEAAILRSDRLSSVTCKRKGRLLSILAPRNLVGQFLHGANLRFSRTHRPPRLGLALLQNYLSTLDRHNGSMPTETEVVVERHIAELVALCFTAEEPSVGTHSMSQGIKVARCAAARADIAANFSEPSYCVADCAGRLGMSVRALQALLESDKTSFSEELKTRRLEYARQLLASPGQNLLRIIDVAFECGYADVSHFNRQFKSRFGESPTSFRGC